ncbi:MAG TPA: HAD-IIIA family hydrolase [Planktothrix sp.]|jgi:D-glycero-D-manno-heptose 1,7-bisphosphate phosphatase
MRLKTVFLDRDGIINDVVMRASGLSSPRSLGEFRITDDFPQLYNRISKLNLFVVTNQPDISRKLLDEDVLQSIHLSLLERFEFREILYCPHDDSFNCHCRKPKPGMILALLEKYGLDAAEAAIIGDSHRDILAGQRAGLRTIYCKRDYNSAVSCAPDLIVEGLIELCSLPEFVYD